jgi:septal ring factor EnvC (AmiA/AmiB activator)
VLAVVLATASAAGALPGVVGSDPGLPEPAGPTGSLPSTPVELEQTLAAVTREHRQLGQQLEQLARQGAQVHSRTSVYGRAYVRKARAGLLPLGGGFEALVEHASTLERLRRAVARGLAEQRGIARRRQALAARLDAVRARREQLEGQRKALARAQTALLAAEDRARAFERAFSSSGPFSHTAVYGPATGPTDPSELAAGFAAMRGRLPFPVPGRTEVVSAIRPGTDGLGLEMHAPLGSPVRAVYPGHVAFADEYAAYGQTVLVDHGDRYYTVYGGLGEIGVTVGEELAAGASIGTVGDTGSGPALCFEIRRGAQTIPAAEWFGI